MKEVNRLFLIVLISVLIICSSSCEKEGIDLTNEMLNIGAGLKVGVAIANINPENVVGVRMEGFGGRKSTSTTLHDTLTARCIVIADDNSIVAILSMDLIGVSVNEVNELKAEIKKATGIKTKNIFIHATHTHSAPWMIDGGPDKKYFSMLCEKTASATVQAIESAENVKAIIRTGQSNVETVNRRNPERNVDNQFHTLAFQNNKKQNLATLLHFRCHPVTLGSSNLALTADYVHFLRETFENEHGGTAIFLNGSSGNINPPKEPTRSPYTRRFGTFYKSEKFGEELANDMLNNYTSTDTLSIIIKTITKRVSTFYRYTNISILDLGQIQIAMLPGEPLDSFGEEVKAYLPGPYKLTMGYTNDYIGYIIPDDEWDKCTCSTGNLRPDCYEETVGGGKKVYSILIKEYRDMVNELY